MTVRAGGMPFGGGVVKNQIGLPIPMTCPDEFRTWGRKKQFAEVSTANEAMPADPSAVAENVFTTLVEGSVPL